MASYATAITKITESKFIASNNISLLLAKVPKITKVFLQFECWANSFGLHSEQVAIQVCNSLSNRVQLLASEILFGGRQ